MIAGERILVYVAVAAVGTKPLVLVASSAIEIAARLDVASHHSINANPPYTTTQIGARIRARRMCHGDGPH